MSTTVDAGKKGVIGKIALTTAILLVVGISAYFILGCSQQPTKPPSQPSVQQPPAATEGAVHEVRFMTWNLRGYPEAEL